MACYIRELLQVGVRMSQLSGLGRERLFGHFQFGYISLRLVLANAAADGRVRGAYDSYDPKRPLEQRNISKLSNPPRPFQAGSGGFTAGREHDERKVRPGRLTIDPGLQAGERLARQALLRNDGPRGLAIHLADELRGGVTWSALNPGPRQRLADQLHVAAEVEENDQGIRFGLSFHHRRPWRASPWRPQTAEPRSTRPRIHGAARRCECHRWRTSTHGWSAHGRPFFS